MSQEQPNPSRLPKPTQCRVPEHEEWKLITEHLLLKATIAELRSSLKDLVKEIEGLISAQKGLPPMPSYDPEKGTILLDESVSTNGTVSVTPSSSEKPSTDTTRD